MAFEVITVNPNAIYEVEASDVVVLPQGQMFTSSSDGFDANPVAVSSISDITLQIFGSVYSGGRAIDFWGSLGGVSVYNSSTILIGSTGIVSGYTVGILTESGSNNKFLNDGQISGGTGIHSYGGANSVIRNGGSITGFSEFGILVEGEVDTAGAPNSVMTNLAGGEISGALAAIRLRDVVGGSSVTNYGVISSSLGKAIDLADVTLGQSLVRVVNHGTIEGGVAAYLGSANADSIVNRGLMSGVVDTGLGGDTLDNRNGTIEGNVLFGDGADFLDNRGGTINGEVDGGLGNDIFRMGAGAEDVIGGVGFDTVDYRFGAAVRLALDDSFANAGAAQNDSVSLIERVFGSVTGNDVIRGDGEANQLLGLGGNDALDGAAGNDVLQGGAGRDTLTGGLGNDTFRFLDLTECGDVIVDFGNVAASNDRFQFTAAAFGGGLVVGALAAADFQTRADNVAQDASDRFIFRTTDRTLWFDADGNGAGAALMVADLQSSAVVIAADISLI